MADNTPANYSENEMAQHTDERGNIINSAVRISQTPEYPPRLAASARGAFKAMTWLGILVLLVGVIWWAVTLASAGGQYGLDGQIIRGAAVSVLITFAQLSVPFFAAAGVIAGLGKRDTN